MFFLSGCVRPSMDIPSPTRLTPLSIAEVVAKVSPAVVQIITEDATGSGVILDPTGHVLTNNHVVEKVTSAIVALKDGRKVTGQLVNRDLILRIKHIFQVRLQVRLKE